MLKTLDLEYPYCLTGAHSICSGLLCPWLVQLLSALKKSRFFLPLTAVYGRWCCLIAGRYAILDESRGAGREPAMFQCTWRTRNNAATSFFLGASLAGFDANDLVQVGNWKRILRIARFNLLWAWLPLRNDRWGEGNDLRRWIPDSSPTILSRGKNGTMFGNRAETYPFLNLFLYVLPVLLTTEYGVGHVIFTLMLTLCWLIWRCRSHNFTMEDDCFGFALDNKYIKSKKPIGRFRQGDDI